MSILMSGSIEKFPSPYITIYNGIIINPWFKIVEQFAGCYQILNGSKYSSKPDRVASM